ncbi:MAG: hypothetical protein ABRQ38_22030 [Candidatus Eremiobacterota bacterium]
MKTIAWDIDDVLNDLLKIWFNKQWLTEHKECNVIYEELKENPPHRALGISMTEYLDSLDNFRLKKYRDIIFPVPDIMKWFLTYGHNYRHIALTAVPLKASHISSSWLFTHFGRWIRTFHFVPSKREGENLPVYDKNKGEYLNKIGNVDIFIDDSEENIKSAGKAGVKTLLIPRPWNSEKKSLREILYILSIL